MNIGMVVCINIHVYIWLFVLFIHTQRLLFTHTAKTREAIEDLPAKAERRPSPFRGPEPENPHSVRAVQGTIVCIHIYIYIYI